MSPGLHGEPLPPLFHLEKPPQASPACTCWRSSARFCYCARKRASPCRRSAGRRLRFPRAAAATAARGFIGTYLIHRDVFHWDESGGPKGDLRPGVAAQEWAVG